MKVWIHIRDEHGLDFAVVTDGGSIEIWEVDETGQIITHKLKLKAPKPKIKTVAA